MEEDAATLAASRLMKAPNRDSFLEMWRLGMETYYDQLSFLLVDRIDDKTVLGAIVRRFYTATTEELEHEWIATRVDGTSALHKLFSVNVSIDRENGVKIITSFLKSHMPLAMRAKLWESTDSDGMNPLDHFFESARSVVCVSHVLSTIADLPASSLVPLWIGGDPECQFIDSIMHRIVSNQPMDVILYVFDWIKATYPVDFVGRMCLVENVHLDTFLHLAVLKGNLELTQRVSGLLEHIDRNSAAVLSHSKGSHRFPLASLISATQGTV